MPEKNEKAHDCFYATVTFFTSLIERFGWAGAFVLVLFGAVHSWASDAQKEAIIDKFLLAPKWDSWVIIDVALLLIVWLQRTYYLKRLKQKEDELRRVSDARAGLQQRLIDTDLHSGRE